MVQIMCIWLKMNHLKHIMTSPILHFYSTCQYTSRDYTDRCNYIWQILAPRIASRLNMVLQLIVHILALTRKQKLMQTRHICGNDGNTTCPDRRPQMTVRPKVMKPIEPDSTRTGEVIRLMLTS